MTTITPKDSRLYLLGFNHVSGIGVVRLQALIQHFGDVETAWNAPLAALLSTGLHPKYAENLIEVRRNLDLVSLWEDLNSQGIQIVTWDDGNYPRRLAEISQPPPLLYVRGNLQEIDEWAVAIVGTRKMTSYGKRAAQEIAAYLVQNNITIISGLARGIDSVAHESALSEGGRTIAVLGSGVDRIYPPEHRHLAEKIISQGAIISDYPPGTEPESGNFPPRNRIISGLSLAAVVIEAGLTSGALITAKFAVEQGREVFALPGSIYTTSSKGTNQLICNGANPLLDPKQILEALNLKQISNYQAARVVLPENTNEVQILNILSHDPVHVDEIQAQVGLPMSDISALLTLMELKGMVEQIGGMNYIIRE